MIGMALAFGIVLWLVMEKTRMGAAVRATVDDAQMARGVGIDTNRISMFIFALGAFLRRSAASSAARSSASIPASISRCCRSPLRS